MSTETKRTRQKRDRSRAAPRDEIIRRVAMGRAILECRAGVRKWKQKKLLETLFASGPDSHDPPDDSLVSNWENGRNFPDRHLQTLRSVFHELDEVYEKLRNDTMALARSVPLLSGDRLREFLIRGDQTRDRSEVTSAYSAKDRAGEIGLGVAARALCWTRTNHSHSVVDLSDVPRAEFDRVAAVVSAHYGSFVPKPHSIKRVGSARAGNVYRVGDKDERRPALLVKCYRMPRTGPQMRALTGIQKKIADQSVFQPFGDYVAPLRAANGAAWVNLDDGAGPVTVFRFLDEIVAGGTAHFLGSSAEEIEDVADKFGKINNVLAHGKLATNSYRWFELDPAFWESVVSQVVAGSNAGGKAVQVARSQFPFIRASFERAVELAEAHKTADHRHPITLTNLHPHHVFTSGDKCVFICDYEDARNDWPEHANVTFAAHRFCREFVRRNVEASGGAEDSRVQACAQAAAYAFLRGYGKVRPSAIQSTLSEGTRWAMAVNFSKLVSNIAYDLGERPDPSGCTGEHHLAEVRKFITHLAELQELERLDWLAVARDRL